VQHKPVRERVDVETVGEVDVERLPARRGGSARQQALENGHSAEGKHDQSDDGEVEGAAHRLNQRQRAGQ
jgi:hypothetical protein